MPPLDTEPDVIVSEGRVVYLCEACGETFKRERGLVHVTCPACGTDAVFVVAHV
jgi:DNA-directed RNA polymerase subunit RPC12/RpoP